MLKDLSDAQIRAGVERMIECGELSETALLYAIVAMAPKIRPVVTVSHDKVSVRPMAIPNAPAARPVQPTPVAPRKLRGPGRPRKGGAK